jgi:hypothetical protein
VFVVRVWGREYIEETILNITVCCGGLGVEYREELILNVTVFVLRFC